MISVKLDKHKHNRKRFDCGEKALNHYLIVMANQQAKKDNNRTYVLEDEQTPEYIIGYYTLTMLPIELASFPQILQKRHKSSLTGGLIARLAVDKRYGSRGFGQWLLIDALKKLVSASKIVGFPLVLVDTKDGKAAFYRKFGFTPLADKPNQLFITIADAQRSLGLSLD